MPITPTYPGVYIEEIASGVRSISGVSTSVTAFLGLARRGPINKAVRIQSYADFERRFGGLHKEFELGYAVAAFFRNGGGEAFVVRLALNAAAATRNLPRAGDAAVVLEVTAVEQGAHGNDIKLQVDPSAKSPASLFDLTVSYAPVGESPVIERFANLSMNSRDVRYAPDIVNRTSELVRVARPTALVMPGPGDRGVSLGGELTVGGTDIEVDTLRDATHDSFLVSCNGEPAVTVTITPANIGSGNAATKLTALAAAIQAQVRAKEPGIPAYGGFTCAVDAKRLRLTSGEGGEGSSVRVLPAPTKDISARLKLGVQGGGTETDAAAALLPRPAPVAATLSSGNFAASELNALPSNASHRLTISIDGKGPDTISIGTAAIGAGSVANQITALAVLVEGAVRAIKAADPAYQGFTAVRDGNALRLQSGTRGSQSSVVVSAAGTEDIADALHLLTGSTAVSEPDLMLQNGGGDPFKPDDPLAYNAIFGDAANRRGIYALEEVDLFNLLVLPGMTDATVQNEAVAYAASKRGFVILDPPITQDKPEEILAYANGPSLTKSSSAAIYYPWILNADPLDGNRLRPTPPSGSVAGLYARTDSNRGIWKAPAGIEANLVNTQGTAYVLTDPQNGNLNPQGVNAVRVFPGVGTVVWGARTLRGDDDLADEYKYVPVRRLAYYIEESLFRGLKWAVFEPNDEPLWAQIRLNAGSFMQTLFRQGAFAGRSPREAYFVKCDKDTTTQADIGRGVVNVLVGFAPLRPAEFVMVSIQQIAGQGG